MKNRERAERCINDENIRDFLREASFRRLPGQSTEKNVRGLANLISRFFEPLWESCGATSTNDLLVTKNAKALLERLLEIGGITDFMEKHREYVEKLKKRTVILFKYNDKTEITMLQNFREDFL